MQEGDVTEATLIDRPNRFLGRVEIRGKIVDAFIPNPGRMYELMVPGKRVFVRWNSGCHRKTSYDMIAVWHDDLVVSIDSNLPNRFMKEMLQKKAFDWFLPYDLVTSEPRFYDGRFDFKLEGTEGVTLIEVKSCTLVNEHHARFPDAPTTRGARHVRNLARSLEDGTAVRAAVVFVIQRPDAIAFSPNAATDPEFALALKDAYNAGVEVYPIVTEVNDWALSFLRIIPLTFE